MTGLENYLRPEVKGALIKDDAIILATLGGLYRWRQGKTEPMPGWEGRPVRAIAKAPGGGFILVAEGQDGPVMCDGQGQIRKVLPRIPGDEAKSILMDEGIVIAGGRKGIWRFAEEGWSRVQGSGKYETIGLAKDAGRLTAYVKKQGALQQPALAVSADGGLTWRHLYEGSYADLARAVAGDLIVTQWGGARRLGDPAERRKEPVTAAAVSAGIVAMVGGSKLEIRHGGRVRLDLKHPGFAEAETLLLLPGKALVAGVQGAMLVDLADGGLCDLFQHVTVPAGSAKLKKLFPLGGDRILATATFGSFLSQDGGNSWEPCRSDWSVLDAVGLAGSGQGWWLATQRGLFSSQDGGLSWKHNKITTRPHHFAEFTDVAMVGDRLAVASKAGLFLSGPGGVKDLAAIPAFGRRLIEGVLADGAMLLVTDQDGGLFQLDPADGSVRHLADLALKTVPVSATGYGLLLAGKKALYLRREGRVEEVAVPDGMGEFHVVSGADRVVVWRPGEAWSCPLAALSPSGSDWRAVPDWPMEVKSVGMLSAAGGMLATDRRKLFRREAA